MLSTGEFVTVNGVRLYVRGVRGQGPALVMIHGLTDNGACWGHVAAQLTPGFDIVAVDLRAHGLSDAPDSGYTASDHARDVIGVIEVLELSATTLIGHSLGADTAMEMAHLRPDLVARLVIEDPPWSDDGVRDAPEERQKAREDWLRGLEQLKSLSLAQVLASGRARTPQWVDAELLPWARSKLEVRIQALDYVLTDRPAWQLVVRGLRVPVLLITGETGRGGLVSEAMADEARSLSAELEVLHLADAGHCVHRDRFDAYLAGLRRFLEQT